MKTLLEFQLNGSFRILEEVIGGITDEEWTSRANGKANLIGFTLWHCLRTIDWTMGVASGAGEVADQERWRDVKPKGAFFGAGVSREMADSIPRTVKRARANEYLGALRTQALDSLRALPSENLDRVTDLKTSGAHEPDHLQPVVWPEIEDLNGIPMWQFLARPAVSHVRVHFGEVNAQLEALRAAADAR